MDFNSLFRRLLDYESGRLSQNDVIDLFQEISDSGIDRELSGHYARRMSDLISRGLVKRKRESGGPQTV